MKRLVLFLLFAATALAQMPQRPLRPVSTFSIVARDPQTGEIGVAVQSHWFAVGQIVPWAEAGVGAVATQSFVDPSYGKLGLDLMRAGKSAPEALKGLLWSDPNSSVRQVAMIDWNGRVAVWTGGKDVTSAGHVVGARRDKTGEKLEIFCGPPGTRACVGVVDYGEDFSVQANLMSNDRVWPAMAKAFEETKGDLAER
ncbi:MAG TPA: DUF1028 domain-containing protein, partial [Terriglobales bacterium]|nr:DUF1028 domain-containing protein [Terriglobales bacterium]